MEENKQNSSDLADLPELELDDLEFQEEGLESLEALDTEQDLENAFSDLDFTAGQQEAGASNDDPFSHVEGEAVATADYDLPESESDTEAAAGSKESMEWQDSDSPFQEETFDSDDSSGLPADELTDFHASDDDIPLPPMMEEDEGPVSLSEDELDRILSTDDETPGLADEGTLEDSDFSMEASSGDSDLSMDGSFEDSDFSMDASSGDSDFPMDSLSDDSNFTMDSSSEDSDLSMDNSFEDSDFSMGLDESDFSTDDASVSDESLEMDAESMPEDTSSATAGVESLEDAFVDDSDFDSQLSMESDFGQSDSDSLEDAFAEDETLEQSSTAASADDYSLESEDLSMSDDDEGPVALSEDELGNILEDVEDGNPQFAEGLKPEDEDGYHAQGLEAFEEDLKTEIQESDSDLDLGEEAYVKTGEEFSAAEDESDFPVFEDDLEMAGPEEEDNTPVELQDDSLDISDDELSEAVLEGEDFSDEELSAPPLSVLDADEDESITLTPEELGNIVSDQAFADEDSGDDSLTREAEAVAFEEPEHSQEAHHAMGEHIQAPAPEEESPDLLDTDDLDTMEGTPSLLAEDEDDTIALSASELDNILEDVSEEAIDHEGLVSTDSVPRDLHEEEREKNAIIIDEGEEQEEPATASIPEIEESSAIAEERQEALAESISQSEGVNKEELKKMISYLDRLFDQLPDDTVREFSRSEYFDLYKKVMQDLGIQ